MPKLPNNPLDLPSNRTDAATILREKYPVFEYAGFQSERVGDGLLIRYHFRSGPGIEFTPEIRIERLGDHNLNEPGRESLDNLVFQLGLVEMLSYWKATCSPEIRVHAGSLNAEQIAWWSDLLYRGMGEFFYVNQLQYEPGSFVKIIGDGDGAQVSGSHNDHAHFGESASSRDLVLTSGGKDSVVTLEFLRSVGRQFDCLLVNPTQAALDVAREAGCASPLIVRRTIDPRLLELNAAGYLNGHTPFSAMLAMLGVLTASVTGHRRVVVSNERSAEEAAAHFLGREVNHQYSKSFRFEKEFRSYSRRYLTAEIEYFSLLRPLYELQIARLFSEHRNYFPIFRSCNRGSSQNAWCCRCPKCMFVFAALYPFIGRQEMLRIFGQDMFAWDGAFELLQSLLGWDRDKPFECVGTREETAAALLLCAQKYEAEGLELPAALSEITKNSLATAETVRSVHRAWTEDHCIPTDLAAALRSRLAYE